MKSIVICGTQSSAELYMRDIIDMGYKPILVNPPMNDDLRKLSKQFFLKFGNNNETYECRADTIDEVAKKLKNKDVIAVVAGSELGVRLADCISHELNLKGNDPATTHCRCTKLGMHDALKKAGIRYIDTVEIKSDEDIRKFWKERKPEAAFMKYSESSGSVGNKVCNNVDEAIEHWKKMLKSINPFILDKNDNKILLQEYIMGDEYIVNSISCNGNHIITDIWKYSKITLDGCVVYDAAYLLTHAEPGIQDLVNYTYDVLNATGFKYGPCHGEYKIDKKGPVLIETNARPMGASMNAEFLDEFLDHHITNVALDLYIDDSNFSISSRKPYGPKKMACILIPIIPYDMDADMAPLYELVKHLKTYRHCSPPHSEGKKHYPKTVDLETAPVQIKLCGNKNDVMNDVEFIHTLEFNYFDLLFSLSDKIPASKSEIKLDDVFKYLTSTNRTLVVKDDGNYLYYLGKLTRIKEGTIDIYDTCLYTKSTECKLYEKYHDILTSIAQVRNGGNVLFLPNVYQNMPFKSVSIELLSMLSGVEIQILSPFSKKVLYGKKI